jgi:hypothetical protein
MTHQNIVSFLRGSFSLCFILAFKEIKRSENTFFLITEFLAMEKSAVFFLWVTFVYMILFDCLFLKKGLLKEEASV